MTLDPRPRWTCQKCGRRQRTDLRDDDGRPRQPLGWVWAADKLLCGDCAHWKSAPNDPYIGGRS